jgi:uncharacterized protein (TIGR02594 family)
MKLPAKYGWLVKELGPKMIIEGLKMYGIQEIPGKKHNTQIMSWASEFGIQDIYTGDEMAWCSLAHAKVAKNANKQVPFTGYELLRAKSWEIWGNPATEAMLGDTLVFHRPGGHHVGIYVAESDITYHILGGNQSNKYAFTEISKDRCIAIRRPLYKIKPRNVRKIFINESGILSLNEF